MYLHAHRDMYTYATLGLTRTHQSAVASGLSVQIPAPVV